MLIFRFILVFFCCYLNMFTYLMFRTFAFFFLTPSVCLCHRYRDPVSLRQPLKRKLVHSDWLVFTVLCICVARVVVISSLGFSSMGSDQSQSFQMRTQRLTNANKDSQMCTEQFTNIFDLQMHTEGFTNKWHSQMHTEQFTNTFQCTH